MNQREQRLIKVIFKVICREFCFDEDYLINTKCRESHIIDTRHTAVYQLSLCGFDDYQIEEILHRKRGAIQNSIRRYKMLYDTDAAFRRKADEVNNQLMKYHIYNR